MAAWVWKVGLAEATAALDESERDGLLLWYTLLRELCTRSRVYGEISTSLEHWCRRYGAPVPPRGTHEHEAWHDRMVARWEALQNARVVEITGDISTGERVRVTLLDLLDDQPLPALDPPLAELNLTRPRRIVIGPVLQASSPNSLRASRSKHMRNLSEGASCAQPRNCLVCSETMAQVAQLSPVAPGLRSADEPTARTSDAHVAPEPAHVRDSPSGLSSKPSIACLPSIDPERAPAAPAADGEQARQAGRTDDEILRQTAETLAKALKQDADLWHEHLLLDRSANEHLPVKVWLEAATELSMRQSLGNGVRHFDRAWRVFRKIRGDVAFEVREQDAKAVSSPNAGPKEQMVRDLERFRQAKAEGRA